MLDRLKNLDMAKMKSCAMNYASDAKSYAKTIGAKALNQAKYIGAKRVKIAGRSVNPFVVGAAVAIVGGLTYLLLKNRSKKMQLAGMTGTEQDYPVK